MKLDNLDLPEIRALMIEEFEYDVERNDLHDSPRLTTYGLVRFPTILKEALGAGTPQSFMHALQEPGIFNATEIRNTKNGPVTAKVPVNAAEILAYGEFNRFYCRAVARLSVDVLELAFVRIYRALEVMNPRPESEAKIGQKISAVQLLKDLREHVGVDTALGLARPNSGLSVRLDQ